MAIIGIDFGTTNTVVSLHDRGTFPVVPHAIQTRIGRVSHEVYPSTIYWSRKTGQLAYGLEAERLAQTSGPDDGLEIRSLKRLLGNYHEGLEGPAGLKVKDLLVGFLKALRASVVASGLFPANEVLEALITWPAHANGAQRAITREAFRDAGFSVRGAVRVLDRRRGGLVQRAQHGEARVAERLARDRARRSATRASPCW